MSLDAIVWVLKNSDATLGARLVLIVLAEYAHEDGTKAFPMVETISSKARMSRKGVQDALRRLEEQGHIRRTGSTKSGTNVYEILGMESGENARDNRAGGAKMSSSRGEDASRRGEESTPDLIEDPKTDPTDRVSVQEAWGKLAPPLPAHRALYFTQSKVQRALRFALKTYPAIDIVRAMTNYATVLTSPAHFWEHRWTFQEFLVRGLDRFVDEAEPLSNFRVRRDADAAGGYQRTPADRLALAERWILETAWRLPLEEGELAEELGKRGVEGPDRKRLLDLWRTKAEAAA